MSFGLIGIQTCKKFLPIFFFLFELPLWIYYVDILNFVFSNIIPGGVSICKILYNFVGLVLPQIFRKLLKFSFVAFFGGFVFEFCPFLLTERSLT